MMRFILLLFLTVSLYSAEFGIEVGLYTPKLSGTITNEISTADFKDDFDYTDTSLVSYLACDIRHNITYLPNVKLSYINLNETTTSTLNRSIRIADGDFNASVMSNVDYEIFSAVLYKNLFLRGKNISLFFTQIYSGDLSFDLGIDTKLFQWRYTIKDVNPGANQTSWINVSEFVPLAYVGMHYYWYNFSLHANSSFLGFSTAEALSYEMSADYMILDNFYLSLGYMYEYFTVKEKKDIVDFTTRGTKLSVKYVF